METSEELCLRERLFSVRERLSNAIRQAGRKAEDVRLIAVSKFQASPMILEANELGQEDFGENYVQEAIGKQRELSSLPIRWHMIGHIQSKKASLVAGAFSLIHTLDSVHLAQALEKYASARGLVQDLLIEVNLGGEAQKAGIDPEEAPALTLFVLEHCPHLSLKGLMCIPPVYDAGSAARPYFARLREIRDQLQKETGLPLPQLSMGMSGDFEWAVLEGATFVRVGTDIFGKRIPKKN